MKDYSNEAEVVENLMDLRVCDCGREYCQFFSAGEGEWGSSYSRGTVESILKHLPDIKNHLTELLEKAPIQLGKD